MTLGQYVFEHTDRGECQCGRCIDVGTKADPTGHTVDLTFFKVSQNGADADTFKALVKAHHGVFNEVDVFDGEEHGYMELGGWIGDQGLALQFMGLGALLELFELRSPDTMLPGLPEDFKQQLAMNGMVTIVAKQIQNGKLENL